MSGRPTHALEDVTITRRGVYPETHPQATSKSDYDPQFQAKVYNLSDVDRRATVTWYLGDEAVGSASKMIPAGETELVAKRISWESLISDVGAGPHQLRGTLGPGMEMTWGEVTIYESQGDDGGPSDGPLSNIPKLPAVGPLTRRQTTLAAAGLAAILLSVIV